MKKQRTPTTASPVTGLYELGEVVHEGLIALVARDRTGKVHLSATVTADYYAWLVERGHVAADSARIDRFDVETHGLPAAPLAIVHANRAAVERRSSARLCLSDGGAKGGA